MCEHICGCRYHYQFVDLVVFFRGIEYAHACMFSSRLRLHRHRARGGTHILGHTHTILARANGRRIQGRVLGRSQRKGYNYRVEYTDGETLDVALREEGYAFGEQPPLRVGIWCILKTVEADQSTSDE
jgi:hypothetical protein